VSKRDITTSIDMGDGNGPIPVDLQQLERKTQELGIFNRMLALVQEQRSLGDDIAELGTEAKAAGFDPGAIRLAVKRKLETAEQTEKREAQETTAQQLLLFADN
jgi:uncharacterized protein (UPF0335 family)